MKESGKETAKRILTNYLVQNKHRKTPERFVILEAVFDFKGQFTIQQLDERLQEQHFPVSRSTLYNTLNLFMQLRLVVSRRHLGNTTYEACYASSNHIHQICTMCNKSTELKSSSIDHAVEETRLKRFRREAYTLYIYGVCSTCQAKITREKNKKKNHEQ